MKRKIVVVTGIRSEYSILYSILKAIHGHPSLELNVIATGAHLANSFGYTVNEIKKDGFKIVERIESLLDADTLSSRIKSASIQLSGLVQAMSRIKPDILVVLGDREEAITTALAGVYMNIPVAHLCGGDRVWGNVDDTIRHAVTKLAHIHFPTTKKNAERIIKMGEEPWRVHCVGNAGLDRLLITEKISRKELSKRLNFDVTTGPIILLIQHPLSSEVGKAGEQMSITMEAIKEIKIRTIVINPNSDAGNQQIIKIIEKYSKAHSFIKSFSNLNRVDFVNVLRITDVLVGNSSCGILEAPLLKLPAVNIGKRQKNREHADNVLFVPHDKKKIIKAVRKALYDKEFKLKVKDCVNPYGDGHTARKVAKILAKIPLNKGLINKDITY